MEERAPRRCSSDEDDSGHTFTFLTAPKRGNSNKRTFPQTSNFQSRLPPMPSLCNVITPKKLHLFQMDLFSPSKEDEAPTALTPRHKRRASSDGHTGLTPGISELLPTRAKRLRVSASSDNGNCEKSVSISPAKSLMQFAGSDNRNCERAVSNSPVKSLMQSSNEDIEMNASHVFANSPGSPSSEFKAMLDDIDISPDVERDGEDFLKRQTKYNMRRCRSLELRKKLIDMTNTPPGAFRKSLFKKPTDPVSEVKCPPPDKVPSIFQDINSSPEETKDSSTGESADHQRIKQAVDVLQTEDLIADGSRHYCLPLVRGKHTDLQNIDHETMAMLVSDRFPKVFDKLTVIDCRYPYEYNGGHIKGSINIYTEEAMVGFLNKEIKDTTQDSQTHILVFHCEFSSQRGPSLLRHLRNYDRQINLHQYPQLAFPEIYCLFGGYKEFYSNHPDLCEPSSYTPMVDEKYASDLRHFRAKAKSWAAGDRLRYKQQINL